MSTTPDLPPAQTVLRMISGAWIAAASWQTGMPVTLPSNADLAKEGLTADALSAIPPAKLDMVTKGMGADLVLLGSLARN